MNTPHRNRLAGQASWLRGDKLTTAPLDADLLSAGLYDTDPIRKGNAYPRQRNYHGFYWMASTTTHVWHESLLERSALMWLDHTADVVAVASQPMKLVDEHGVTHYPDILTLDARGIQTVYDVKPHARINDKAHAQFEWTRDICETVGWDYRILTELPVQYHVNLTWLAQFRQPGHHPGADAEQEFLAHVTPEWTIADAVASMTAPSTPRARSHVFHLLWTGALSVDMNARLSDRTPIRLTPHTTTRREFPHAKA
ncbi:TnsA-like heteromeric transposase endonuclease subunit (plasmid) [Coraliomargarita sp. W4R53]